MQLISKELLKYDQVVNVRKVLAEMSVTIFFFEEVIHSVEDLIFRLHERGILEKHITFFSWFHTIIEKIRLFIDFF